MRSVIFLLGLALAGCGHDSTKPQDSLDASANGDSTGSGSGSCGRVLAPDGAHHLVVSKPYTAASDPAPPYEVLAIAADGTLTRPATPVTFAMHRTSFGSIAFTPDGKVGLVAQEDGTLGVFALAADGTPSVIAASFGMGMFYASRVVVGPSGAVACVDESDTQANGGGTGPVQHDRLVASRCIEHAL